MTNLYKIPLVLHPQQEGGYTVSSPILPELITEGDNIDEVLDNLGDALQAVIELYEDMGKELPINLVQNATSQPIWFEHLLPH